jgi:hypothetical protein
MKPNVEKKNVRPYGSIGLSTGTDRAFLLTGLMAGAFQRTLMLMISEGAGARKWVGVVGLEMENSVSSPIRFFNVRSTQDYLCLGEKSRYLCSALRMEGGLVWGWRKPRFGAAKPRTIGKMISLCFTEHTVGSWGNLFPRSTTDSSICRCAVSVLGTGGMFRPRFLVSSRGPRFHGRFRLYARIPRGVEQSDWPLVGRWFAARLLRGFNACEIGRYNLAICKNFSPPFCGCRQVRQSCHHRPGKSSG